MFKHTLVFSTLMLALASSATVAAKGRPGGGGTTPPDVDQVLPIRFECSPTIKVWAQDMTQQQLIDSCAQLAVQEQDFHQRLATGNQPVAYDYNDSLRVVVFDDYNQYNTYGYDLFGINTNNGGMYIEGNPADPANQASFYAHEADWLRPEFQIWNLRHEYIHYLDGRFVSYGGFNHYPSKMVWWAEGLAEYLSLGTDNGEAVSLAQNTRPSRRPSLGEIFLTDYRDSTDRIYRWSYLAVRFLFEQHYTEVLAMTDKLKQNDFNGYSAALNQMSSNYGTAFSQWIDGLSPALAPKSSSPQREQMLLRHSESHRQGHNQKK
ncbi:collagenase [Shewanella sedimentimangrovi]|uniref:Collagenase n=1 Tax=Shewanella sedimentimangrovi TaxID=2814293 RepID=A0ABX7QWK3_9GAMM|nr:collagenase [Shewanella sedimentimangrovi]QSX35881.1 collagenase [Shewanella sedimentimangrovi]